MTQELYDEWMQGALWGSYKLSKATGITQSKVEKALQDFEGSRMFYKQQKKTMEYDKILVYPPRMRDGKLRPDCFYVDLMDWAGRSKRRAEQNKGFKWVLCCIDGYSRYLFAKPLKTKSAKDVLPVLKLWLEKYKPWNVTSDKESAVMSKQFQSYMQKSNINFHTPTRYANAIQKWSLATAMVERVIRTIRTQLYKYEKVFKGTSMIINLRRVVNSYNNSVHRMIGQKPVDVFTGKVASLEKKEKLVHTIQPGDYVRVRKHYAQFKKRSQNTFSKRIYRVKRRAGNAYILETLETKPREKGKYPYRDLMKVDVSKINERRKATRKFGEQFIQQQKEEAELGIRNEEELPSLGAFGADAAEPSL